MTEGYPLPPIRDNRSDAPAPTPRVNGDWPQARDQWPWTLTDPRVWLGLSVEIARNFVQVAEMMLTRRGR